jgi:hypothetical protein
VFIATLDISQEFLRASNSKDQTQDSPSFQKAERKPWNGFGRIDLTVAQNLSSGYTRGQYFGCMANLGKQSEQITTSTRFLKAVLPDIVYYSSNMLQAY